LIDSYQEEVRDRIIFRKMEAKVISPDILKNLYKPAPSSQKGQNGRLFIIGGNDYYHGAPLFCAKIASKIVDLVFFSSIPENNELLLKMKSEMAEFIAIKRGDILKEAERVEVILIGPGMGTENDTREITNGLLKKFPNKKFVLDADALRVVDKQLLGENCVLTPNRNEFKILFDQEISSSATLTLAQKYNCVIVAKGSETFISDGKVVTVNKTGNQGLTKGGTGDVLAGLIASLATKNDLFLAAKAGTLISGAAADHLKDRVSYYFNASDLIEQIPITMKEMVEKESKV